MRKALVKTYIYELIFLCIYLIVMNKLLEIFEEKFILGVFIILIINIVVFFYLIILLRSQYYVYKLNLSKSIVMEKKLYKMKKINIMKDIHRINLSAYYRLLNKEEEASRYLTEVRISRFTFPIVRYCYYMNLAEYKYYNGKKEEARKIFDENIKKESNKNLLEIFLDYGDDPEQKVVELEKILPKQKNRLYKLQVENALAITYEEIENFEIAMEFYKEVAEKESEIYFVKIAKEKVLELSLRNKEI